MPQAKLMNLDIWWFAFEIATTSRNIWIIALVNFERRLQNNTSTTWRFPFEIQLTTIDICDSHLATMRLRKEGEDRLILKIILYSWKKDIKTNNASHWKLMIYEIH